MTGKKLKIVYFLPLLLIIPIFNVLVDPASLFSSQEESWVNKMISGENVYVPTKNNYILKVKRLLIQKMPKEVDCILFGTSITLGVSKDIVGVDKYYNLSTVNTDLYGLLFLLNELEKNNIKTKKIIFSIETYLFDETIKLTNSLQGDPAVKNMIAILNEENDNYESKQHNAFLKTAGWYLKNIFSLKYFQSSIKTLRAEKLNAIGIYRTYAGKKAVKTDKQFYTPDGSYYNLERYETDGVSFVLSHIRSVINNSNNGEINLNVHISEKNKEIFEKIIKYYTKRGVKIELFLCPIPPTYWNELRKNNYPILDEQEQFAKYLAKKYGLSVTGSMNPYNVGIKDEDYLDYKHIKYEMLDKYFDFKK